MHSNEVIVGLDLTKMEHSSPEPIRQDSSEQTLDSRSERMELHLMLQIMETSVSEGLTRKKNSISQEIYSSQLRFRP